MQSVQLLLRLFPKEKKRLSQTIKQLEKESNVKHNWEYLCSADYNEETRCGIQVSYLRCALPGRGLIIAQIQKTRTTHPSV